MKFIKLTKRTRRNLPDQTPNHKILEQEILMDFESGWEILDKGEDQPAVMQNLRTQTQYTNQSGTITVVFCSPRINALCI